MSIIWPPMPELYSGADWGGRDTGQHLCMDDDAKAYGRACALAALEAAIRLCDGADHEGYATHRIKELKDSL